MQQPGALRDAAQKEKLCSKDLREDDYAIYPHLMPWIRSTLVGVTLGYSLDAARQRGKKLFKKLQDRHLTYRYTLYSSCVKTTKILNRRGSLPKEMVPVPVLSKS